jgi:dihydrodiol dehydrogenase / D-xylose 1-dehydrogenase (NADP)
VGSRSQSAADMFGGQWKIPRRHGSYAGLMNDPEVDAVYIATPHPMHYENALACLAAGKATLCEKPFTINARQAEKVIALARNKRIFLMEAMWTRFLPVFGKIRSLLAEGALGDVRQVQADFCFQPEFDPQDRKWNLALGGGALLDIGVYPISLASMVFGEAPKRVVSAVSFGSTGVDEQSAEVMEYSAGRLAVIASALRFVSPVEAHILGTAGRIRIHPAWWNTDTITVVRPEGKEETLTLPNLGNGYAHEAIEVMNCLRSGKLESRVMPLEETLRIMQTMDAIRADWSLKYPGE